MKELELIVQFLLLPFVVLAALLFFVPLVYAACIVGLLTVIGGIVAERMRRIEHRRG